MLGKTQPTTSKLNLVNSEVFDTTAGPDVYDGINMADLVESLDARELDIGDGEENYGDGNYVGVCVYAFSVCLKWYELNVFFLNVMPKSKNNNKQSK